jgi:ATP-dependent RNA helicase RhlE
MIQMARQAAPATGITQAVYPVPQELKSALLVALLERGDMRDTLVFTRTKHRANRLHDYLVRHKVSVERIHGNRSQAQRTAALAGFKNGRHQVLVATDIAARGIDVETLGHVVNFDVPLAPEDYIHRVGRTARAEATGFAFTLVAPNEEDDIRRIERAIGKPLPRATVSGFDYQARPDHRLEIPLADRIREIRARKASDRARAAAKAAGRQHRAPEAGHRGAHAAAAHGRFRRPSNFSRRHGRTPQG